MQLAENFAFLLKMWANILSHFTGCISFRNKNNNLNIFWIRRQNAKVRINTKSQWCSKHSPCNTLLQTAHIKTTTMTLNILFSTCSGENRTV